MYGEEEIFLSRLVGKVLELFVSKKGESNRVAKEMIRLDKNGVLGDKFYAKDLQRSVLLSTADSYLLAKRNGIDIEYGLLGENILLDYNPYLLVGGARLEMGGVILEVTQNCTICNHLSVIDKKLPKLLKDDRGIFVKVVQDGEIKKGDEVYLLG